MEPKLDPTTEDLLLVNKQLVESVVGGDRVVEDMVTGITWQVCAAGIETGMWRTSSTVPAEVDKATAIGVDDVTTWASNKGGTGHVVCIRGGP
jgi:hypothetical protein